MEKIYLHIIFLLMNAMCYSQPTFIKMFRGVGTAKHNLSELVSGNINIGVAVQSGLSLMDENGEIIQSKHYVINMDGLLAIQSVRKFSDNLYYFTATYRKDSCEYEISPALNPVLGRMDSLGNIFDLNYYVLNAPVCLSRGADLEVLSGGQVAVWERLQQLFIIKTDSSLSLQWAKRCSEPGDVQFVKELPGGDLLVGINMDGPGAVVARMDAEGNFLWVKSYMRPSGRVHDAVIESDGSFVITGVTESTTQAFFVPLSPTFQPKLFMMNLNGEGEVMWCRGYDSGANRWYTQRPSNLVRTLDGHYAVLATLAEPGYNVWYRPLLMKTDLNGDTLWTRSVGRVGYTYETVSLLAYSDGGFVYNGRIHGSFPDGAGNWAFIYKTDSLGQLPCFQRYHPVQVLDLFPVDSSFTLSSVDGAVSYPAFAQDTIYPPLVLYDGCTFTTGIPQPVRRTREVKVYPNPTPGRFTVEFTDPLLRESYYSVYDATGRLLFQRPLPAGATLEEVDLSRFGRGTYVLRVTDPEEVRHERVVVE
jgi:hypothetical protein